MALLYSLVATLPRPPSEASRPRQCFLSSSLHYTGIPWTHSARKSTPSTWHKKKNQSEQQSLMLKKWLKIVLKRKSFMWDSVIPSPLLFRPWHNIPSPERPRVLFCCMATEDPRDLWGQTKDNIRTYIQSYNKSEPGFPTSNRSGGTWPDYSSVVQIWTLKR